MNSKLAYIAKSDVDSHSLQQQRKIRDQIAAIRGL